jgi:hypothetical protein
MCSEVNLMVEEDNKVFLTSNFACSLLAAVAE